FREPSPASRRGATTLGTRTIPHRSLRHGPRPHRLDWPWSGCRLGETLRGALDEDDCDCPPSESNRTETGPSGSRPYRVEWPEWWYVRVSGTCEVQPPPPGRQSHQCRPRVEPTVAVWPSGSSAGAGRVNSAVQKTRVRRQSVRATPGRKGEKLSAFRRPS